MGKRALPIGEGGLKQGRCSELQFYRRNPLLICW